MDRTNTRPREETSASSERRRRRWSVRQRQRQRQWKRERRDAEREEREERERREWKRAAEILSCPSETSYSCRVPRRQYFTPVGPPVPPVRPFVPTLLKEFLRSLSIFNHSSTFHCQWRHLRLGKGVRGMLCVELRRSLSASFVSLGALFVRERERTQTRHSTRARVNNRALDKTNELGQRARLACDSTRR